jgi:hypothetical protein
MTKDIGRNNFDSIDQATEYFKEIYGVLPESVIKDVIEFCLKNPKKFPDGHDKIDLSKVPIPKKEIEKIIEGAVEIYDNPDDPRLKIIKHKEGTSLLTKEEAEELQEKITKALEQQKEDDVRDHQDKYEKHNKTLLKAKLKELKSQRTGK